MGEGDQEHKIKVVQETKEDKFIRGLERHLLTLESAFKGIQSHIEQYGDSADEMRKKDLEAEETKKIVGRIISQYIDRAFEVMREEMTDYITANKTGVEVGQGDKLRAFIHDELGQSLTALKINYESNNFRIVKEVLKDCLAELDKIVPYIEGMHERKEFPDINLFNLLRRKRERWDARHGYADKERKEKLPQLSVRNNVPSDLYIKKFDDTLVQRAFDILVTNAFKACLEAHQDNPNEASIFVSIHYHKENNTLEFVVTDDGIGMDVGTARALRKGKEISKFNVGTGFGWQSYRRALEAEDGEMHFESKKGQGTTMEAIIPLSQYEIYRGKKEK